VIRLPGGRAAAFHEQTISFSWTVPDEDPVSGVRSRFEATAALITQALAQVGIPSAIGEVPGEYCSGEYSVNHAGRIKLAGLGQRLARRAAHVGGVLVVGGATRLRDVLVPVYEALDVPMNPRTVGAVDDVDTTIETDDVIDAMIEAMSNRATLTFGSFDDATLERAADLAPGHVV
jgi:lipoate-protein ligase A